MSLANHYTGTLVQQWPSGINFTVNCEVDTCMMLGLALIYFLPEEWILVYNVW
jgi:hypothetical protein